MGPFGSKIRSSPFFFAFLKWGVFLLTLFPVVHATLRELGEYRHSDNRLDIISALQ